jgi:hypothetical protein
MTEVKLEYFKRLVRKNAKQFLELNDLIEKNQLIER